MQESINWLKNYFSQHTVLPSNIEDLNYFEAGIIDSLGVIELIEAIESHFQIQFNETHFQERRFSNIRGLAEIIHEIQQELVV